MEQDCEIGNGSNATHQFSSQSSDRNSGYFSANILVSEISGRTICESQWSQPHKTFVLCVNLCAGHLDTANRAAPKRHRT